jgi:hypothetical protein
MFTLINKNVLDQMFKVRTCAHTHTHKQEERDKECRILNNVYVLQ